MAFIFTPGGFCADPTNTVEAVAKSAEELAASQQQVLRSYLQLQEQLHSAMLTLEQSRRDAEVAARSNAQTIADRLNLIEQTLTVQRRQEAEAVQSSNRTLLVMGGCFGALGLLGVVLMSWFQLRAMNRLASVASALPALQLPAPGAAGALEAGNGSVVETSNTRLLGAIERLEKRVLDMERTAPALLPAEGTAPANGAAKPGEPLDPVQAEKAERISLLLGKGQTLLNLDQPENALACFEEALGIDANHAEALVKKGAALERLKRLEEAIECYNRAIAVNNSMTLAYLCKGGIFNQLERFSEALECYEQALRTQHRTITPASDGQAHA